MNSKNHLVAGVGRNALRRLGDYPTLHGSTVLRCCCGNAASTGPVQNTRALRWELNDTHEYNDVAVVADHPSCGGFLAASRQLPEGTLVAWYGVGPGTAHSILGA